MTDKEKYELDVQFLALKTVTELKVLREMVEDALTVKANAAQAQLDVLFSEQERSS